MLRLISIVFFLFLISTANAQQLAFPGATGFGRFASGARGGEVYHVTNLNDSGEGSLRDAVSQPNRTIVFDVAGIINIKERMTFAKNLTIAGQTAPGEGIVVYGNGVSFSGADNMICRYMRFRMGIGGDSGKDAAGIANGKNMIFDHVSVTWGRDETFSISWDNKGVEPGNITIQNSIIGQGLQTHSCGGLVQTRGGVTLYRNLYIDNHTRNPKVKGLNQFVNNVVYNWGGGGCYILGDSEGTSWATIVNNYFIEGPNSTASVYSRANENFQLYASGNYVDANVDGTLNGTLSKKEDYGPAFWLATPQYWADIPDTDNDKIPQMHPEIPEMMTAEEAYSWIVENAGCTLPSRDQVDQLLIAELTSLGTKGIIISSENELSTGGPGVIFSGKKQTDTDYDGMPDTWEEANGTDKNVNDAALIGDDGYSNIEKYINSISEPMAFLKYPVNIKATGKTTSSVSLQWENLEDKLSAVIIEYGSTDFSHSMTLEGNATSVEITGLESNTKYNFRLKSVKGSLESDYSAVYSLTTNAERIAPLNCTNPNPANSSLIESGKYVTLHWENSTGIMAGTLYYDVYFGSNANSMEIVASQITTSSYELTGLQENTRYFWRVQTSNLLGSSQGETWNFTTGEAKQYNKVLYLPFDETEGYSAFDQVHQAEAISNNFTPQWLKGKINNSIYIPGSPDNNYLQVKYFDELFPENKSFTITLWFKSPGGKPDSYLLHKGMHDNSNNGVGKWIGIQYKNNKLTFAIDDNNKKTALEIANANKWFDNQWHFMACIRDTDNKTLKLYIDGQLEGETADNTGDIRETGDMILGNRNGYFDNPYVGYLDELKIFDSALLSTDIYGAYIDTTLVSSAKKYFSNELAAYPNPFTNEINISTKHILPGENNTLRIVNMDGEDVVKQKVSTNKGTIHLAQLQQLPKGIYLCIIENKQQKWVQKMIK